VGNDHLFYQAHFKPLYKYFVYRDVSGSETEDLCQEVFLRFFAKYDHETLEKDEQSKILYTIAKNVYREWLRQVSKGTFSLLESDLPETAVWESFIDEVETTTDDSFFDALHLAIGTLNPTLRQVIELRFLQMKTRAEVAEILNTKEKYVHIYQQRALKQLQKAVSLQAYTQ